MEVALTYARHYTADMPRVIAFYMALLVFFCAGGHVFSNAKKTKEIPVTHGSRIRQNVALTFDACEGKTKAGYDTKIIKILIGTKTPATLFLGGKWMLSHKKETKELAKESLFELGNHSYSHPHLMKLNAGQIAEEIKKTQNILFELTGKKGKLFRCPFGEYDATVLKIATQLGVTTIQYDVVSGDPDKHITAKRMVPWVVLQVKNGSIIIMHINGRGWHTAEALPKIIAKLRAKGFQFVTVSELLKK